MRTRIIMTGLALLATACFREPLFPGTPRSSHEPSPGRQRADTSAAAPPGQHVYLTAVRFPDGYAWDLDTCAVDGDVWIDLYRDGNRIRSVPAGASVHPDMHRFAGGHLYTDYSTETETVLSRNGVELFRYEGRESLRGFLVREDGIHTLGQDRDGDGFTYRIDGRVVFRSETGEVLGGFDGTGAPGGALTESGEDDVFYACWHPSERGREYHVMRNSERYLSFPAADGTREILVSDGVVSRVQSKPRSLVLEVDGAAVPLGMTGGEYCLWCRMAAWEGDVLALVCAKSADGKRYFLQTAGGRKFTPPAGEAVSDLLCDGKRLGWTVTDRKGSLLRIRWSDGSVTEGTGGYLASGRCALLHDGRLLLALTGRDGVPNRFQEDDARTDIPFNGYFTSVTVE